MGGLFWESQTFDVNHIPIEKPLSTHPMEIFSMLSKSVSS